ncbi:MAG TPA: hypothetical protein VGM78_12380, partial [Ilumatobacteraceae bacterium]
LEAVHGDLGRALDMFATSIDSLHQAGDTSGVSFVLASLAIFFTTIDESETAATLYGTVARDPVARQTAQLAVAIDDVRNVLDAATFAECSRAGAAMSLTEAVRSAHRHTERVRPPRAEDSR